MSSVQFGWNHLADFIRINFGVLQRNGGWASVGKRENDIVEYEGSNPERKNGKG